MAGRGGGGHTPAAARADTCRPSSFAAHVLAAAPSLASASADWMTAATAAVAAPRGRAARLAPRMMPVGVPRVPYRLPKSSAWVWIDIWNVMVGGMGEPRKGRGREESRSITLTQP